MIDQRFMIQVSIKHDLFKAQLHFKTQMLSNHSWGEKAPLALY